MRLILINIYKALIYVQVTLLAILLCVVPIQILAQPHARDYPNKPVKLVIPYVAGGGIDIIARTIAQKMSTQTGHKFIVENRLNFSSRDSKKLNLSINKDGQRSA